MDNKSLLAFEMEVESLMQLTYSGENHPLVDHLKTKAFINGIGNPDIKYAVCATHKATFVEPELFILAYDIAQDISRPQIHKVYGMKTVFKTVK